VFVTGDCGYHLFHDAAGRIALVDAGHYETEAPVVASVVERLRKEIQNRGEKILVRAATAAVNPVAQSV
jgi:putative NIF3 family GTP cyclohydrolase 1 type 2